MSCENFRRTTNLSNRAPDVPQVSERAYAACGRRRRNRGGLVAYSKCNGLGILHHHGSLLRAAVMDRWPSFIRSGPRKLLRFHQCLKEWRQFTLARSQHGISVPTGVDNERSCPAACATCPMMVGRDRCLRNWSLYQDRCPRRVGPRVPRTLQCCQHQVRSFRNLQEMQRRGQWRAFNTVTKYCNRNRLEADYHSPAPTPKQAGNTRATCRGIVDKLLQILLFTNA